MEYREEWETEEPSRYVKRALAKALAGAMAPVVVLEGARRTGKTTLVKNEAVFEGFHYVTLADESELARATAQLREWMARLPRPAIIDDAHRNAQLIGEAQRIAADEQAGPLTFVLVTSEVLLHDEEIEPRPERFTLFPLTQAEIHNRTGCIIDDLFDGDVMHRYCNFHTRSELRTMMRVGGYPERVMRPVRALSRQGESMPTWRLGLQEACEACGDVEDDIDQMIERAILGKVLANPGLALGVDAIAASCCVDAATFSGYLEALQNRFLIHRLTLLDKKPQKPTSFAKTRIHMVDSVFAVESLLHTGHDITVQPPVFAKVLRALCFSQLLPALQWASEPTECFHWRKFDHRMREVDLVLKRGDRIVGIKVRNSLAARHDTIGALRILAKDARFARGFIFYMGMTPRHLAENIWAVPVSALWEAEAFLPGLTNLLS